MYVPLATLVLALAQAPAVQTGEAPARWPQFLGPGGVPIAEPAPRSLAFDREKDVAWRVALPRGASSPCIDGDRIFLTAAEGDELVMLAFERATGKELWRRTRKARPPVPAVHVDVDPASPTPCTDGTSVVFYFGTYGLVVLDRDGAPRWEKPLPFPEAPFGVGSSPILVDDLVILARDGCPDAAIHAYAKSDGSERWSVPRIGFTFSFGTPFVWRNRARRELVVAGTQRLASFDPKDGKSLWQLGGLTTIVCTSPAADEDTLYFAAWSTPDAAPAERGEASFGELHITAEELADSRILFARLDRDGDARLVRDELPPSRARDAFAFLDHDGDGAVTADELKPIVEMPKGKADNLLVAVPAGASGEVERSALRWSWTRGLPYVASPLVYRGRLYLVASGGMVTCLDPKSGKPFFERERLADHSEYYATPVGTGGHVIVCSSAGTIHVLRAADTFELERAVELGEPIHATPAIVDGRVYLRTDRALWAFGK